MKRVSWSAGPVSMFFLVLAILFAGSVVTCSKPAQQAKPAPSHPSEINVEVRNGGPIVVTTKTAEFQILPSGFLQATLLKDGKRLTLDEPPVGSTGGSDSILIAGKEYDFIPEFNQAKVQEASGKLGRGKRVEITARPLAAAGVPIERTLVLEANDDFPGIALVSTAYKNVGTSEVQIEKVLMQEHRLILRAVYVVTAMADRVAAGEIDPYSAADELVASAFRRTSG